MDCLVKQMKTNNGSVQKLQRVLVILAIICFMGLIPAAYGSSGTVESVSSTYERVRINFSDTMDPSTINRDTVIVQVILPGIGRGTLAGKINYTGTTATFSPSSDLIPDLKYKVILTTGVKDKDGNPLASDYISELSPVSTKTSVTIMHVNDTHSHLDATSTSLSFDGVRTYLDMGGVARLVTKVADVRASEPEALVLQAGDTVQGTLYFTKYQGEAEFSFMNMMKFDAMVIGNHEFDKGPGLLAGFINDLAEFPIISANIDASNDSYLSDQIEPYVIKTVNGEKVGIFGLTLPDTSVSSSPGDDIIFEDEKTAAQRTVQELENQGVNKIIALTHLGYGKDIELAESVEGIDIVIGGHSHSLLGTYESLGVTPQGPYPTVTDSPAGNRVCIVQSWEWAKTAGVLEAEFNADGTVSSCRGNAVFLVGDTFLQKDAEGNKVEVDAAKKAEILAQIASNPEAEAVEEDSDALAMLAPYKEGIAEMKKEVVATVAEDLLHIREPGTHASGAELPNGSLIAPVVCWGMLWKTNSVGMDADLALLNAGGVRTDILAGDLTVSAVYTIMPFGNTLFVLNLSGKDVKTALEKGLSRSDGAFPYVAGIRYTADKTKPEESRLVSVEIKDDSDEWTALDDNTVYRMVTISYIAGGGDGYDVLENASGYDTGFVDAEVFMEYAQHMGTLYRPEATGVTYITESSGP